MCTLLYCWLVTWLNAWDEEPFSSILGLILFVVMDLYLTVHWILQYAES